MIKKQFKYVGFLTLLLVSASAKVPRLLDPIIAKPVVINGQMVEGARVKTHAPLHFLNAWSLKSSYKYFGGVSAMLHDSSGFTALTDSGTLFRFDMATNGTIRKGRVAPLPTGCAQDRIKYSYDTESMTRDPRSGEILIGFEWRNAICRANASLMRAIRVSQPRAMRGWPQNGGPEAMVTLHDGRTLIFEERAPWGPDTGEGLIFIGDPTANVMEPQTFRYKPPSGFRPTDAAQLPDGRILIVNRQYQFPISFLTEITIVPADSVKADAIVTGKTVARIDDPVIADNFEAIAISEANGHIFIWLMSDNNFNAYQHTYLVQFELVDGAKPSTLAP
ncbi:MAG: esterase-like activity of phytase family protein [Sphingomonadaceae bacterium]